MAVTREIIMTALGLITLPDGGDIVGRDMIRALTIDAGKVSFVIEAETPAEATRLDGVRRAA